MEMLHSRSRMHRHMSLWAWNYIKINKTNGNKSRPPVLKEKKKWKRTLRHVDSRSLLPLSLVSEHHLCCKDRQWWHYFCKLNSLAAEGRPCLAFNPTWLAKTVQHRQRRSVLHHTLWGSRVPDYPQVSKSEHFWAERAFMNSGNGRLMELSLYLQTHICWLEQKVIWSTTTGFY